METPLIEISKLQVSPRANVTSVEVGRVEMRFSGAARKTFLKTTKPTDVFRTICTNKHAAPFSNGYANRRGRSHLPQCSQERQTASSKASTHASSLEAPTALTVPESQSGALIREKFLRFFEARGHRRLPSASLIPDDPTVLLTIAGMLPFKPIFLGQESAEAPRVTTTQKCVRTNDIENVGRTARHHTFFEMLGNFSFGDYFKEKAIDWAWELSTKEYGIPPECIWVSVFEQDDEAYDLWTKYLPRERIVRMGKDDNFWAAGPTGPCGPCSELYYDFHSERGTHGVDLNDDERFIEYYNLVFMEMNRSADGSMTELKNKNIDTGMGLERMAQILQGVPNNYETDLLFPIVQKAAELTGVDYGSCSEAQQNDLKVIGDHMRAVTYLISDGVVPSNLGRGYVVRRLIRRLVMKGRLLGAQGPFAEPVCLAAIALSTDCDPNVELQQDRILSTLTQEETQFSKTLAAGQKKLNEFLSEARESTGVIPGKQAFMLFDTFGFPLEITREMAEAERIKVDVVGFEEEMERQKDRSKAARTDTDASTVSTDFLEVMNTLPRTIFLGYEKLSSKGKVLALIQNGSLLEEIAAENGSSVELEVVLDQSPFYSESGGQIGDKGTVTSLSANSGAQLEILDVRSGESAGLNLHKALLSHGRIKAGESVVSEVNEEFRHRLMCHHTATHLLQSAIKQILGTDVCQQGSLVAQDRLRFDFNSNKALTEKQISEIDSLVNAWIQRSLTLTSQVMGLEEAKSAGAIAMFGEKYGNEVRVVEVPGVSMELCGGTHVQNTSQLSAFKIVSESAIQSGIRRIEAVAGPAAVERFLTLSGTCEELKALLKVDIGKIPQRVAELQKEVLERTREIEGLRKQTAVLKSEGLLRNALENGVKYVVGSLDDVDGKALQSAVVHLQEQLGDPSAVVVGSVCEGRVSFAVAYSPRLVAAKLHAGKFVSEVAKKCGGGGGGRPNLAQAGAKDVERFPEALKFAKEQLEERLSGVQWNEP